MFLYIFLCCIMTTINASDDSENSIIDSSENTKPFGNHSGLKFEEDVKKYKAALLYLNKTYPDSIPDFDEKLVANMLKGAYRKYPKSIMVQRVLQSFQNNIEKIKNDIELIRNNRETGIKPLMEREEMCRIKNAVASVMLDRKSNLKSKHCKYPPTSAINEILSKLGFSDHIYHSFRTRVGYHAHQWMKHNIYETRSNISEYRKKKSSQDSTVNLTNSDSKVNNIDAKCSSEHENSQSEINYNSKSNQSKDNESELFDIDMNLIMDCQASLEEELNIFEKIKQSQISEDFNFMGNILVKILNIMKENPSDEKSEIVNLMKQITKSGDTPLHLALRSDQQEIIESYMTILGLYSEFKFIINLRNNLGKTPLHYAVMLNRLEVVKNLLRLGADPNLQDIKNSTPLHVAVTLPEGGACVDLLLMSKPNLEVPNEEGLFPLHLAARDGSLNAVKSLIEAGAFVNSTDIIFGRTVLHIAAESGNKNIVEYLLEKTDIDIKKKNFNGDTALCTIRKVERGFQKEICELLNRYDTHSLDSDVKSIFMHEKTDNKVKLFYEREEKTSWESRKKKFDFLDVLKTKLRNDEAVEKISEENNEEYDEVCSNISNEDISFALDLINNSC